MTGVFDNELSTAGVPIELIASMCRSARRVRLADRAALYAQGEPANALNRRGRDTPGFATRPGDT